MKRIAVFGGGGRVGRAVTTEAKSRGYEVSAIVRDPSRYPGLDLVRGDVRDPEAARGFDAVVSSVTPASSPATLGVVDPNFFTDGVDALLRSGVQRLVLIGLFANLHDRNGGLIMDDPALFPAQLRPFAVAHTAGLTRLRESGTTVDWVMLTPPAELDAEAPRIGRYRIGGDEAVSGGAPLSHADLALAVVDEIQHPAHHRTRVSVFTPAPLR